MLAVNSTSISNAYLPAANHQGRFNTLLCKASRLLSSRSRDIYVDSYRPAVSRVQFSRPDFPASTRTQGLPLFVYQPTTANFLQARERVINVAVTSGVVAYQD
ncbi:uncharacterized protein ALTATR162_LOCUS3811 [Alternaria atra]|uniref:Uncharacterized protein n=1 Tax=Alternaria atra TaxID=119953 RepID=A0A8J2HXA8_9PLEO|nr:uncharacterized protein ALTATR162_LOCUS3811 [Alternaria atra]CAG5155739.1 unnamed protein product [Alternaria atra]